MPDYDAVCSECDVYMVWHDCETCDGMGEIGWGNTCPDCEGAKGYWECPECGKVRYV